MKTITIPEIEALLVGKHIKITHTGNNFRDAEGICRAVAASIKGWVAVELEDGRQMGCLPDTITNQSVEGDASAIRAGRRKFEVVATV